MQLDVSDARERGECPACKGHRFDYLDGRAGSAAAVLCGRNAVQLRPRGTSRSFDFAATADQLVDRLADHGQVRKNEYLVRADILDAEQAYEITLFVDGRAIIKGTDDPDRARSVYARFVGT